MGTRLRFKPTNWRWFLATARRSYSLVELIVVIALIVLIGALAAPNLFSGNDRFILLNQANRIKAMIDTARTSSLAPSKSDPSGQPSYQVVFSSFPKDQATQIAQGSQRTNTITLQRSHSLCADKTVATPSSIQETLRLPRGVYVSAFYPARIANGATQAIIAYNFGKLGFRCGAVTAENPNDLTDSADFTDAAWEGDATSQARYLWLEISSVKVGDKAYVVADRLNNQVFVSRTNPQSFFVSRVDTLTPCWVTSTENLSSCGIPGTEASLSARCGLADSEVTVSFSRALDRYHDNSTPANPLDDRVDPSRLIYYDISFKPGAPSANPNDYSPIAVNYFFSLNQSMVSASFRTASIVRGFFPSQVSFKIWAHDSLDNRQTGADPVTAISQRDLNFTVPLDLCG